MLRTKKKCRIPKRRFSFDVARKFWRRTSKNDVAKGQWLWGLWNYGSPCIRLTDPEVVPIPWTVQNYTKLLFSMDCPWTAKMWEMNSVMVPGNYAVMLGNYAAMWGNYAVMLGNYDGNFCWCLLNKKRAQVPRHRTNLSAHLCLWAPTWSTRTNENNVAQKMITMSLVELRRSVEKIAFWHKSAAIEFLGVCIYICIYIQLRMVPQKQ